MAKTIFKYPIENSEHNYAQGWFTEMLDVQYQDGQLVVWAIVDKAAYALNPDWSGDEAPVFDFQVYGTGWPIMEKGLNYLGTVQEDSVEQYVWHVFYKPVG